MRGAEDPSNQVQSAAEPTHLTWHIEYPSYGAVAVVRRLNGRIQYRTLFNTFHQARLAWRSYVAADARTVVPPSDTLKGTRS